MFFRILLVIPHLIWLALWGIAVWFAVLAAWVVGIFAGRVPDGLHGFIASYLRYLTHVYAYYAIAADPFPAFSGAAGYPVDVEIAPPHEPEPAHRSSSACCSRSRPTSSSTCSVCVASVVTILAWLYALFAGKQNAGIRDVLAYWLRYNAQTFGYLGLLTQRYPSFSDD